MKAYVQINKDGEYYNVTAYTASVGFKSLGFEVEKYVDANDVLHSEKDVIFVGGVGMVRRRLANLGIQKQDEIEYPTELRKFLQRKVWKSTLKEIIRKDQVGIFVKPVKTKLFTGKVIHGFKDYIGLNYTEEVEVWCSEVVNVVTEWRCFVRYAELLDVRYYKGKWDSRLDIGIVQEAIEAYTSQQASYCLDFGVDKQGKHYLIEVNDGHSLGSYGMGAISYAKFLSARWAELTQTEDYLRF